MGTTRQQQIYNTILNAVVIGNGKAAEEAVEKINEDFILIRKSDLPAIEPKDQGWGNLEVPMARTAGYRGRKPRIYWERALDFISVALYAEQEEAKKAERELDWQREEAWKMLHPLEANWDYKTQPKASQKQIDVVVNLMRQVDELKASK